MKQVEIVQQLKAAVALHSQGELDKAESIYRHVLDVDSNNFYALRYLGCLCRVRGAYVEGIDLLRKAVSLRPSDADCLYNYGNILGDAGSHSEAIAALESCLMLRDDFAQAKETLGWSLFEVGDLLRSEEVLVSAVTINPELFQAWFNLGNTFKEQLKFPKAIESYRKAIEVRPDFANAYLNLGTLLKEEGELVQAAEAYAQYYRLKPIAQSFSISSAVDSQLVISPSEVQVPESAEFISSYVSNSIPFGMHLMYVHVPKAGGVRFSNPIFGCIQEMLLKGVWANHHQLVANAFALGQGKVSLMASDRIDSEPVRDGITTAFSSYKVPPLDFSFLTLHGISSREIFLAMKDQFDVKAIRLATWRNPEKRLRSALEYFYRISEGDVDLVRAMISQRDPFLDNAIYRGCFSDYSPQVLSNEQCDPQVDFLVDIGDFSVMNQIMGSFLSRCRLPNIVVNKKVNETSDDNKMDVSLCDSLMEQCVEKKFLSLDCSSEIEQMVSRKLPADFALQAASSASSLHPLTFVVNALTDSRMSGGSTYLLPTEYLQTAQGQEFLQNTFA